MKLDPQVKALLTAINAAGTPSIDKVPVDFAREMVESGYAQMHVPVKVVLLRRYDPWIYKLPGLC